MLARAACAGSAALRLLPVAQDLWRVPAADGGQTAQLVVVRDGLRVWLIGSGPTPAFGDRLVCAIRRETGHAVSDVVNTRAAAALALGNSAFTGARLWALAEVRAAMRERCASCLQQMILRLGGEAGASLHAAQIQLPLMTVQAGRLGPFDTRVMRRAPAEPVLVLRHRRSGHVIAQGLLWAGAVPDLRETDSGVLLASLRELRRFAGRATLLGEQGDPATLAAIDEQGAYIDALRQAVMQALQRGELPGARLELPAFVAWPRYAQRHPINVQHVWRELEDAWLLR